LGNSPTAFAEAEALSTAFSALVFAAHLLCRLPLQDFGYNHGTVCLTWLFVRTCFHRMKNLLAAAPLHVSGLLALLVACEALGASVRSPSIRADGRFQIQFDAVPGSYAILFRGTSVTTIQNAVALSQTATGLITLIDPEPTPGSSNRFYRVQWVPLDLPRDVDGDGIFHFVTPSRPSAAEYTSGDAEGSGRLDLLAHFLEELARQLVRDTAHQARREARDGSHDVHVGGPGQVGPAVRVREPLRPDAPVDEGDRVVRRSNEEDRR
jgi:hypothetical protein